MGSIVCTSFVHDCIRLFSFVHLLLFFLSQRGLGTCYAPFLIWDSKIDSFICISFVHDCIQLFSFVHLSKDYKTTHLILFYLPWGGEGWLGTCYTFLILDSKMGSIVCTSFVYDCIRLFSFVHLLLFFLSQAELGTCYPSFLILDSKIDSIVCSSFGHDCIQLVSVVNLILSTSLRWGGWRHAIPPF